MHTTAQSHVFTEVAGRDVGSKSALWTGRALSTVAVLFLVFDSLGKLLQVEPVVAGTMSLGYPASVVFGLGVTSLPASWRADSKRRCYAVLLTGYLGGAVAAHVRVKPLFSHIFPTYVALWGGSLPHCARARGAAGRRDQMCRQDIEDTPCHR
jgi:hypothetical protein